jgi:hypothetical protein
MVLGGGAVTPSGIPTPYDVFTLQRGRADWRH